MVAPLLAAAVPLVGNLLGGLFGGKKERKAQQQANATNIALAREANAMSETQALRNREWALADYATQKADMASQFVRLREAADAASLNPLTVLGAAMVPGVAGGQSSASYQAAQVGAVPPLLSTQTIQQGFQGVGDILSGQTARDIAEQQARTRLMNIEADRMSGIVGKAAPGAAAVRTRPSVTQSPPTPAALGGWSFGGQLGAVDEFGFPDAVRGSASDRATDVNRVQNENWFKEMQVGARTFYVYNDESTESEIASTLSLATLPWQWAYQVARDRFQGRRDTPETRLVRAGVDGVKNFFVPMLGAGTAGPVRPKYHPGQGDNPYFGGKF